jgi:hypothetical protein
MGIPESQLDTWSHQGAVPGSRDTYATVKRALEATNTKYANRGYEIFLQGSYCNDTNIFFESDVDIVIRLNTTYNYSLNALSAQDRAAFDATFVPATYLFSEFKTDVIAALEVGFPNAVHAGPNAIKIDASGNRRSADVLATTDYRNYTSFPARTNGIYPHAILFVNGAGEQVVNYPKLHSQNCTTKHQATNSMFKPMVRILKNARGKLETDKVIEKGTAPSYYLEGLLYNAPKEKFVGNYGEAFVATMNWILEADRSTFKCAHEQTKLLGNSSTSWKPENCNLFLEAFKKLWNEWA